MWARFDGSIEKLQHFVEGAKPRDYGALAPLLFEHAEQDDPIARFIIERGQTGVTLALDHIVKLGVVRICLLGSIGKAYRAVSAGALRAVSHRAAPRSAGRRNPAGRRPAAPMAEARP